MKKTLLTVALLLTVIAMLGAGPAKAADPIKIGMTISTTGNYMFASSQGFKGAQIWADDVNARGGIEVNGEKRPVKLVYYDDRSEKQTVVRLYDKLINEDKVDICFAPFGSTLTGAAAAITEKFDKMLVIWSAASDAIYNQGYKYIVSATEVPVSLMPKPEVEHMASLGVKSVAISYVDEPFPAGMAKYAKQLAEEKGIDVVLYEKYSPGNKDFTILLQKVKAKHPEAYYHSGYLDDQKMMLRQMKEANLMFPYTYLVYSGMPQWGDIGADGWYIFGHTNFHEKLNWPVNAGMDRAKFLNAFNKKFPDAENPPDFQTSLAYGAGVILEQMIKKADSTDAAALKQAALALSGKLTVLPGPYEIDERGLQLQMPFTITQVAPADGYELELVYPEAVATKKPVFPIPGWNER